MKAVKYYHSKGVVRDLEPDNILLVGIDSEDLRVKIIDFGTAKSTGNKKINLNTYCGTIDFIAP